MSYRIFCETHSALTTISSAYWRSCQRTNIFTHFFYIHI